MDNRNNPCYCGSGKKVKKCHEESEVHPESAFAELLHLYKRIDDQTTEKVGAIRCQKGCAQCCYEHFNISSLEYYLIIHNILKRSGIEKVKEIASKGESYWQAFSQANPDVAIELGRDGTGEFSKDEKMLKMLVGIADDNKRISDTPCMFLDQETNTCSIYSFRPIVCRTYGVGYMEKIEIPFAMCDKIPDGLNYQEEMADLTDLYELEVAIYMPYIKELETQIVLRSHPIFYLLHRTHQDLKLAMSKINEYKRYPQGRIYYDKTKKTLRLQQQ